MARQLVDTEVIERTAVKLRETDRELVRRFEDLRRSARRLENWNSRAGDKAQTTMYQLFQLSDQRSAVLQNYVTYLDQLVKQGYVNAETSNVKLADQFK